MEKNQKNDEKLQKVLAREGVGSRREMERVIAAGRVSVNGKVAALGDRVTVKDTVFVDGHRVALTEPSSNPLRVILYNKPEGEICSRSDPEGRRTVYDRLPKIQGERWISVGRLDFNTSGLLLFTNDGDLANKLMHPSSMIDREYLVRVQGAVDEEMLKRLREGVQLEDGMARFTDIVEGSGEGARRPQRGGDERVSEGTNHWFYCVVMEGRNREVRRLWESQEMKVSRLKRVRYGNIFIPSHVRVGQWIELTHKEISELCQTAGTKAPKPSPTSRQKEMARERQVKRLRAKGPRNRAK